MTKLLPFSLLLGKEKWESPGSTCFSKADFAGALILDEYSIAIPLLCSSDQKSPRILHIKFSYKSTLFVARRDLFCSQTEASEPGNIRRMFIRTLHDMDVLLCCGTWIRTKIHCSRGSSPTIRRSRNARTITDIVRAFNTIPEMLPLLAPGMRR